MRLFVVVFVVFFVIINVGNSTLIPYGGVFTPTGNLNVLIVYINFGQPWDNLDLPDWPANQMKPNHALDKSVFYNDVKDFLHEVPNQNNLSSYYFEMSRTQFRMMFESKSVTVDASQASNWDDINRLALDQLKLQNPNLLKFDQRTNNPIFSFDNSSSNPDNIVDYVVFVNKWDNHHTWNNYPAPFMVKTPGNNNVVAISSIGLECNSVIVDNKTFIHGFTFYSYRFPFLGTFVHELAHSLYFSPHYADANYEIGNYFYSQNAGWSMMSCQSYAPFQVANACERWMLGWTDIKANGINSDIHTKNDLPLYGEFILNDFVTQGDAIRIEIPNYKADGTYTNGFKEVQHLWIENHQGVSVFDKRANNHQIDGCNLSAPPNETGLTLYVEEFFDRNKTLTGRANNAINFFNSKGKYDYVLPQINVNECHFYGNTYFNCIELNENPYSGQTRMQKIRDDIATEQILLDKINNQLNQTELISDNSISPALNEGSLIFRRNNLITQDYLGVDVAFQVGSKIGICSNPPISNYPGDIGDNSALHPFIINGVCVELLQKYTNGSIKVRVSLNKTDIYRDLRLSGYFILPNIEDADYDFNILPNKTVVLNQNRTPNRSTKVNGFFALPSKFVVKNGAILKLNPNSKFIVSEGSELVVESGGKIEIEDGALLEIQANSKLTMHNGSYLKVSGKGNVEVNCKGNFCTIGSPVIDLIDPMSFVNLHSGSNNVLTGCNPTVTKSLSSLGKVNSNFNTPVDLSYSITSDYYCIGYPVNTIPGTQIKNENTDVIIETENEITLKNGFEIVDKNCTFEIRLKSQTCP